MKMEESYMTLYQKLKVELEEHKDFWNYGTMLWMTMYNQEVCI